MSNLSQYLHVFKIMKYIARNESRFALPIEFWQAVAEALDEPEHPEHYARHTKKHAAVVLVSGGLDSTYAYYRAKQRHNDVRAIYIDFGQVYASAEKEALEKLNIPYLPFHVDIGYQSEKSSWKHIIPLRNLIALNIAAYTGGENAYIYFGVVDGENPKYGGDKSQHFISLCSVLFKKLYGTKNIVVLNDCTKADIVHHYMYETGDYKYLLNTISCYNTKNGEQCGKCQACLRRYIAFRYNGISDEEILWNYKAHPLEAATEALEKYKTLMQKELAFPGSTKYSKRRAQQTLSVIAPGILSNIGDNND